MSSNKHENTEQDLNKPYEENEIGLKGIFGFAIGLFLLIVITFGLRWAFLNVLKDYSKEENAKARNPMQMSEKEQLPPEPRLQLAPGFGIDTDKGRVNLELMAPGAEYKEYKKLSDHLLEYGRKDEKTGMVTVMPIDEAKDKFLKQNVKAKSGAEAEEFFKNSRSYVTDASAGRMAAERRR